MSRTSSTTAPRFNFCYNVTTLPDMEAAVLAFDACPFAILGLPDFAREDAVAAAAEALATPVDAMPDEKGFIPAAWDRIRPTVNAIRARLAAKAKSATLHAFRNVRGLDQLHKEAKARAFGSAFHAEWLKAIMAATATAEEIVAHNQPQVDAELARDRVEKAARDRLHANAVAARARFHAEEARFNAERHALERSLTKERADKAEADEDARVARIARQQERSARITREETKARKREQKRVRLANEAEEAERRKAEEAERRKAEDLQRQIDDAKAKELATARMLHDTKIADGRTIVDKITDFVRRCIAPGFRATTKDIKTAYEQLHPDHKCTSQFFSKTLHAAITTHFPHAVPKHGYFNGIAINVSSMA